MTVPLHDFLTSLVYEDEGLLILNKPSGLLVHPTATSTERTLVDYLMSYHASWSTLSGSKRPGIVHRLDKWTEGVMVIAKQDGVHQALKDQFQARTVTKRYYAVVKGNFKQDYSVIDRPIARHPKKRHLMWVMPEGREAVTEVTVLKRYNTKTLLDLSPKTGRTHQLRVHLAYFGYPVLEDSEYGKKKGRGQLLQAYSLSFQHPVTKMQVQFSLPMSSRLGCL